MILLKIIITPKIEFGTKAEISVPKSKDSTSNSIKKVTFLIDNSGSMRGYMDFSGNKLQFKDATKSLIAKTGVFMGNCENILAATTLALCNGNSYSTKETEQSLNNYSAFTGPVTEVDKLISNAILKSQEDGSISIVVSDLVLSYGKSELINKKDKYYNLHNLENLKTSIQNQFHRLKNEDKGVLIVKYESDFNGNFYCNYTENIEPVNYKDSLMEKRPFYFIILGNNKAIKELCYKKCIPTGYTHIFSSIPLTEDDMKKEIYTVTQPSEQVQWILGNPNPQKENNAKENTFTISLDKNIKQAKSSFTISFTPFVVPDYVNNHLTPKVNDKVIESITDIVDSQSFTITTRPYSELPKKSEIRIEFQSPRFTDFSTSSIKDDVNCSSEQLKGRTWGFEAIAEAMFEAYNISKEDYNTIISLEIYLLK